MDDTLFTLPEAKQTQSTAGQGTPRVKRPDRQQIEWRPVDLNSLIAEDHPVRLIWAIVERLDLAPFYGEIQAIEGHAGRSAIDPMILLALWLYATTQGVGSARALERLCREHAAYRWLCGGVSVNYHTLADFRVERGDLLDELLTKSVAVLMFDGLVQIERVAHDGKRVRASAGAASFRRRPTLEKCQIEARQQVEALRQELEENPGGMSVRQKAARERAVKERQARVDGALKQMEVLEAKQRKRSKRENKEQRKQPPRASTTDAEARRMKMADGGFRPAYNIQISTDTQARIIVNVDVSNQGSDAGLLPATIAQIEARYDRQPQEALLDGGFVDLEDITQAEKAQIKVYAPLPKPKKEGQDPYQPRRWDTPEVSVWRQRMATPQAKEVYKQRASTAEWVNAWLDNWGLHTLRVRGLKKVKAVTLWFALAFNLLQGHKLRLAAAQNAS